MPQTAPRPPCRCPNLVQFVALFLLGGWDALIWAGALRLCWVYHVTWFVNSASHVWGYQDYNTGEG